MSGLDWEYNRSGSEESASYRGFTIKAVRDDSPENPFNAWDSELPTCVYSSGSDFSDYSKGAVLEPLGAFSDASLSRHWRAIAKALSVPENDHESEVRENLADARRYNPSVTTAQIRRELFQTSLDDAKPSRYGGSGSDYLDTLETLWKLAGVVAVAWSSSGYSQGDYADGLSVATPEWVKLTGAPADSYRTQCEASGTLWGSWAWGDVYGFVIVTGDHDDEQLDSCWGYYGADHDRSGLEEAATQSVDSLLDRASKARSNKLALLIKAKTPLQCREAILADTYAANLSNH